MKFQPAAKRVIEIQRELPTPEVPKTYWQPLCLDCEGPAEKLYKGTSYCRTCCDRFRRTHNE